METDRLRFRPYQVQDFPFFLKLWQDPEVVRFIGNGRVRDKSELKQNFPYWLSKSALGSGVLLMTSKASGRPVGHAGLVPQVVDGIEEMEVGYWVAKQYWGYGLATEAAQMFVKLAASELGYGGLVSIIHPENTRSIRVAEKIGMKFDKSTTFKENPVSVYRMTLGT